MRSRYRIIDAESPYFLTATVVHWLPVFTYHDACDIMIAPPEHARYSSAHCYLKNDKMIARAII